MHLLFLVLIISFFLLFIHFIQLPLLLKLELSDKKARLLRAISLDGGVLLGTLFKQILLLFLHAFESFIMLFLFFVDFSFKLKPLLDIQLAHYQQLPGSYCLKISFLPLLFDHFIITKCLKYRQTWGCLHRLKHRII